MSFPPYTPRENNNPQFDPNQPQASQPEVEQAQQPNEANSAQQQGFPSQYAASNQQGFPVQPAAGQQQGFQNDASNFQNQGYQNQGYQGQDFQNQGYQNQGFQNQGYQNQGYQNQPQGYGAPQGYPKQGPNIFQTEYDPAALGGFVGRLPAQLQKILGFARPAVAVTLVVCFVALLLPVVSSNYGVSINYFSKELSGPGWFFTIMFFLCIGANAALIFMPNKNFRVIAASVTGIVAILAVYESLVSLGRLSGVSVGAGIVLLVIFSILSTLLSAAVMVDSLAMSASANANASGYNNPNAHAGGGYSGYNSGVHNSGSQNSNGQYPNQYQQQGTNNPPQNNTFPPAPPQNY